MITEEIKYDKQYKTPLVPTIENDNYYLSGKLIIFDKPGINDRIITLEEFEPHLKFLKQKIYSGKLLGECGIIDSHELNLSKISHAFEEIGIIFSSQYYYLYGKMRILDTDEGKMIKEIIDSKNDIFSCYRISGSVEESHIKIKKISAFDITIDY